MQIIVRVPAIRYRRKVSHHAFWKQGAKERKDEPNLLDSMHNSTGGIHHDALPRMTLEVFWCRARAVGGIEPDGHLPEVRAMLRKEPEVENG